MFYRKLTTIKLGSSRLIQILLAAFLAMLLTGCASEEEKCWRDAEVVNTIESYENYLKNYSQGVFVQKARSRLRAAYVRKAIEEDTIEAYEDVIARYKDPGEEIREALVPSKTKLVEDIARTRFSAAYNRFKTVIGEKSISAYESFLKEYPEGRLADHLRVRLREFRAVKLIVTLTGQADGMVIKDVEMCARQILSKNGFRISNNDQENLVGTITIMIWGATRSRPFTSQSDPKDVRQCVTSWRISGKVSLEVSGKNLGSRDFKDQQQEDIIPGVTWLKFEFDCQDSSSTLKGALCGSRFFTKALSELVAMIK